VAFSYGNASNRRLATCDPRIARVMRKGLQLSPFDITIVWGYRTDDQQLQAFLSGASQRRTGSKHQYRDPDGNPYSQAVDFAPWCRLPGGSMGIPWKDTHAFAVIGGILLAAAAIERVPCVYGGDWDMDGTTTDQMLMDWGHIELAQAPTW
jgi:hypothetical protein